MPTKPNPDNSFKKKPVSRSLGIISKIGFAKAEQALRKKGWTKGRVQIEAEISEKPVSKFFNGIPIDRKYFIKICEVLGLDPDELSLPEAIIDIPRPPVSYYAGRSHLRQLNDLDETFKSSSIVSISEMSGHGKTEFVLKYIWDKIDCADAQFTGGAKFIDLHKNICEEIEGFFLT